MTQAEPHRNTDAHLISDEQGNAVRDRPWIIRTYSGHSSPKASNELYRSNLAKGQTGLSIAFDLQRNAATTQMTRLLAQKSARSGFPLTP